MSLSSERPDLCSVLPPDRACGTRQRAPRRRAAVALLVLLATAATAAAADSPEDFQLPAPPGPPTGLADSAALRATVFGTPPQDIAPMPQSVPLQEINIALPWARPVPPVFWFDRRLRAWYSPQPHPAALVILIAGTGSDGNASSMAVLRGALYGAGYHVLCLPSPTFPRFIVAASSTGVAGDLLQDSRDLYAAMQQIVAHLPHRERITEIHVAGYSLGGAHAAVVKSLDAASHALNIHRAVMINPPVSLFDSIDRIDEMFTANIGTDEASIERLYRSLYARIANAYRSSQVVATGGTDLLTAAAGVLHTDTDFSAAIALSFRLALMNVFFAGDLYSGAGIVVDPRHPPGPDDSLSAVQRELRSKPFSEYFRQVLAPYYVRQRPDTTVESLRAESHLQIIGDVLHSDPDYYALTNSNDLILIDQELAWLRATLGPRLVVYDHGGHLGNLGERRQMADLLQMLAGRWAPAP